jgi:hypothetical protein
MERFLALLRTKDGVSAPEHDALDVVVVASRDHDRRPALTDKLVIVTVVIERQSDAESIAALRGEGAVGDGMQPLCPGTAAQDRPEEGVPDGVE